MVRFVSALLVAAVGVGALKLPANHTAAHPEVADHTAKPLRRRRDPFQNNTAHFKHATTETVKRLRDQLQKIAGGLNHMLKANGALAGSKIGPEMKVFLGELQKVLKETETMKDYPSAMAKLEAAKQGIASLTNDLTMRQESIMKEEETQKDSLLVGVLMTHQKDDMADQLAILNSADFKDLPVSQYLLAKHNTSQPLFGQAATYLDTHAVKGIKVQAEDKAAVIEHMASKLEGFEKSMEKTLSTRSEAHVNRMKKLEVEVKKAAAKSKQEGKKMQAIMNREEHEFMKYAAMQKHDIASMKSAVAAIKKGDTGALEKAQAALKESLEQMKNKNAGFLVLLDMGHKLMQKDCPYCVAQCVDKCHQDGQPYTTCLTTCADAGK